MGWSVSYVLGIQQGTQSLLAQNLPSGGGGDLSGFYFQLMDPDLAGIAALKNEYG